jgi:hypothetical protein
MSEHVRWKRRRGLDSEAVRAGYEAAKRAYQLGQAVRARRLSACPKLSSPREQA